MNPYQAVKTEETHVCDCIESRCVCVRVSASVSTCCFVRTEEVNHFWHQRLPGQTVLLCCTAERIHLHTLDIGTCLDGIRVGHKVWQSWWKLKGESKFFGGFFCCHFFCENIIFSTLFMPRTIQSIRWRPGWKRKQLFVTFLLILGPATKTRLFPFLNIHPFSLVEWDMWALSSTCSWNQLITNVNVNAIDDNLERVAFY